MLHFSKSDEETNSSPSWMAWEYERFQMCICGWTIAFNCLSDVFKLIVDKLCFRNNELSEGFLLWHLKWPSLDKAEWSSLLSHTDHQHQKRLFCSTNIVRLFIIRPSAGGAVPRLEGWRYCVSMIKESLSSSGATVVLGLLTGAIRGVHRCSLNDSYEQIIFSLSTMQSDSWTLDSYETILPRDSKT